MHVHATLCKELGLRSQQVPVAMLVCFTVKPRKFKLRFFEILAIQFKFRSGYLQSTVNSQKTFKWLFTVNCQ